MIEEVLRREAFVWRDVTNPDRAELEQIAAEHKLHPVAVQDCLEPDHMPKLESFEAVDFIVVRAYDVTSADDADTVRELTRKLAVFVGDGFVLTIHRAVQPYVDEVKGRFRLQETSRAFADVDLGSIIVQHLLRQAILTYERPLAHANERLDRIEEVLFKAEQTPFSMLEGYYLHRKGVVFKHMLKLSADVVDELTEEGMRGLPYFRDVRDHANRLLFYATELEANATHLLNLALSIASQRLNLSSHRSNEIMRVLTVFSAFFLPLNFIAGVYGMNFENMPELKNPQGYHLTLGAMLTVAALIVVWFAHKGWLRREKIPNNMI